MEKVEEIERKHETEVMAAAAKKKAKAETEFSLPKREFGAIIAEMRREGKASCCDTEMIGQKV